MVTSLLLAELCVRTATWCLAAVSLTRLAYSSIQHTRLLAHALCLSPLLGLCCASYSGLAATVVACALPCCLLGPAISAVAGQLGWPIAHLPITWQRAAALSFPTLAVSVVVGPLDLARGDLCYATALLVAARLVWSCIRLGLIMPTCLVSRSAAPMTAIDRLLAKLPPNASSTVTVRQVALTVTRLRLDHVEALAVTHPQRPDKWLVVLPGNGEFLAAGFGAKLQLALQVGCSVVSCDYRDVGGSAGLLLSASEMVDDAARCVRHCEGLVPPAERSRSILVFGHSMGGAVATELVARHFPALPLVNERSFASLSDVSSSTLVGMGLPDRPALRRAVRLALSLAFGRVPWSPPLETAAHWRRLPRGNKLVVYHPRDRVIGHEAALHTALARLAGGLEGTDVVRLGGLPDDAHNEGQGRTRTV